MTTDNTDDTDKRPSLIRGIRDIRGLNDAHLAVVSIRKGLDEVTFPW
jgi:hypothetical protein